MPVNTFNALGNRTLPFPQYHIFTPEPGQPAIGYMLGKYFWGIVSHHDNRTEVCTRDTGCTFCDRKVPTRWIGYIPFLMAHQVKPCIVKLTIAAADILVRMREQGMPPESRKLTIARADSRRNSKLIVKGEPKPISLPKLPEPFNPLYSAYYLITRDAQLAMQWAREAESKLLECERKHREQYPELYPDLFPQLSS